MKRLSRLIATVFYIGYSPVVPGTAGSLAALFLFLVLPGLRGPALYGAILASFTAGVWASGEVERQEKKKDPSCVVIDELAGMWLTFAALPAGLRWIWFAGGFVLFRIFDILKPFPVNRSQALKGGWGIMIDDILAAVYAQAVLRLFLFVFRVF